jgi:hypothetical protein
MAFFQQAKFKENSEEAGAWRREGTRWAPPLDSQSLTARANLMRQASTPT